METALHVKGKRNPVCEDQNSSPFLSDFLYRRQSGLNLTAMLLVIKYYFSFHCRNIYMCSWVHIEL